MGCLRAALLFPWLLLCALLSAPALAVPLPPTIELAGIPTRLVITPQVHILRDQTGSEQLATALHSTQWQDIDVPMLQEGYSTGAFWLRGQVRNDSDEHVTRWLALGSARLQDVRLYWLPPEESSGQGSQVTPRYAGTLHPLSEREIVSRTPMFPLTLAPGEQRQWVLRIAGDSAIDLNVTLWEPAAFRQEEGRELAIQAFVLGVSLLLVAYALIQGIAWRDRGFVLMAAWIVTALAYICAFQGYLQLYLFAQGAAWIVRAPATLGCLATLLYVRMSYVLVGLHRLHVWKIVYTAMQALLLAVIAWTALGDYRITAPLANAAGGLAYLIWLASMLHGWRRGLAHARLLTLSFALAWLGMSLKLLELNGLVDRSLLPDWHFAALFQMGLLCLTTVVVIGRALELHRKHDQMQWAMLYMRVREQLKLEQAVATRTRELREALEAADQANRAKTGFLTRISHDLRTPLTSILGFADMLQTGGDERARHGRIIVRSARHMLAMVNDLIDYARGDRPDLPQPAPVYVHALLQEISQEAALLAQRQHNAFGLQVAPTLPPVLTLDARRVRRILGNLLDNAAKYTRDGRIVLQVLWHPASAQSGMGVMEMQVRDTGCGIPLHFQRRVFEPFERAHADRSQPGIGMGLTIVRQWIQQMGGQVALSSQPGQGTTMTLRLPAAIGSEHDIARHDAPEDAGGRLLIDGEGRLVLVVEDHADIAHLLGDQLGSVGFAVELYADGESAIARIAAQDAPVVALVLTDYQLPGLHGDAVLQAARQHLPGVPVLLLSATLQPERGEDEGEQFDACLLKPVNFLELQETIGRLLALEKQPVPGSDDAAAPPLQRPPPDDLRQALALIEIGAVSDLLDWCERLLQRHPQCAGFEAIARQLVLRADLSALEALCQPPHRKN
ncbi:hybrid sensor histidine kinase/response regulator [Herbaspirillum sp. DW155]|uniref:hybrid sensor histidine kinase/response regulator n=1 Tax=Herbaspirillum sp. DW155 TaxID=3095609 RepID=UPI00308A96BD|nr:hybrid sensor histidine kinase/response regulator [Herbaspirillum sp. DW155]